MLNDQSYDCRPQVLEKVCSSGRKLRCWRGAGQIRLLDLASGGKPGDEEDEDEDGDDRDDEDYGNGKGLWWRYDLFVACDLANGHD